MEATLVPSTEAKTKFFELLKRAKNGESFVITHEGQEAARLTPLEEPPSPAELSALFIRIAEARKGTTLNAKGKRRISVRDLIDEGKR